MLNVISLGAGVQSSTMSLMAAAGEITPMPDCAIFADTQNEPSEVYRWLEWLEPRLPFPVHKVTSGDLAEDSLRVRISRKNGKSYTKTFIPSFSVNEDGSTGMFPRKCTTDYKIVPIERKMREMCRPKRRGKTILARQWIGISLDEAHRMRTARKPWITNVYPLIDLRMSRRDCLKWMEEHGHPRPPKSACVFCPFHSDATWKHLKDTAPAEFDKAVDFERRLTAVAKASQKTCRAEFLHSSRIPLNQVDFDPNKNQMDLFGNECEGLCGT